MAGRVGGRAVIIAGAAVGIGRDAAPVIIRGNISSCVVGYDLTVDGCHTTWQS